MKNNPCYNSGKGCERRCVTSGYNCHSDCPDYKKFSDENIARSETIRKKKGENAEFIGVRLRSIDKTKRSKPKQTYWKG